MSDLREHAERLAELLRLGERGIAVDRLLADHEVVMGRASKEVDESGRVVLVDPKAEVPAEEPVAEEKAE